MYLVDTCLTYSLRDTSVLMRKSVFARKRDRKFCVDSAESSVG